MLTKQMPKQYWAAREDKLTQLMREHLQAREGRRKALEEVRKLHQVIIEKGNEVSTKQQNQYKQAVNQLSQTHLSTNRLHIELSDVLVKGLSC